MSDDRPVYLGVPATHTIWTQCARSIMTLDLPPGSRLDIEEGPSLPAKSRNMIIERFLEDTDLDLLMLVDSDMRLPTETPRRLASWGKPAVWALAFLRVPPYAPIPTREGETLWQPVLEGHDGLLEVDRAGAGCLLVEREALETVGYPWFKSTTGEGDGEDAFFCDRLRDEGYRVLVDFGLCARHVGATAVGREFATAWWDRAAREEERQREVAE